MANQNLKNLYDGLVLTKNLSQKIGSQFWHPGPGNLGQKGLNLSQLWRHHKKTESKTFEFFKLPTKLSASFEGLWTAV